MDFLQFIVTEDCDLPPSSRGPSHRGLQGWRYDMLRMRPRRWRQVKLTILKPYFLKVISYYSSPFQMREFNEYF